MGCAVNLAPLSELLLMLVLLARPLFPVFSNAEPCNISSDVHSSDDICFISSYANATGSSDSAIPRKDIKYSLLDNSSGIMEVKFPILKKYITYELRLSVDERPHTQEECNRVEDPPLHSVRLFDVFSCKDDLNLDHCGITGPSCTKFTSVKFSHVFAGCYDLHITPKINGSSGEPTNLRFMIHSHHKKSVIWNLVPSINEQSYPEELLLRIYNLAILFKARLAVKFQLYSACDDLKQEWVLAVTDNTTHLQCESTGTAISHPSCEKVDHSAVDSVACTFYNITPGEYCVILEPIERDRCSPGTVWTVGDHSLTSPCKYQYNFTFREAQNHSVINVAPTYSSETSVVAIGVVGALAAFVLVGVAAYVGLRCSLSCIGSSHLPQMSIPVSQPLVTSKPHVLLLYAQDCEPFMKLMATFRSLLMNVGKCEVLDCFDPFCSEHIAPAPEEWIRRSANTLRVIVVVSDCAVELQKTSTNVQRKYKYPLPYSHLFRAGLKEIMANCSLYEYCRVFVVRFDHTDLNFVTPLTRFLLPNTLKDLLGRLNLNSDVTNLSEYKDGQKLKDDISEFLRYKRENPDYVSSLMTSVYTL